ncbi:Postacrosomal sheath WW domain-binding protein [Pteropus alecto]|uniref:Postacrosomal sheath WW domain-binding protein n=1 Tax=Pteropus alecto TaxID=9402 RepID=L5KBU6_PTEAL|nr:Postacrosomal sheath WW domain-binding protein [Pteropus alecto]
MAVNQSHTENRRGAIIPYGESVLKQCQDVDLSFLQQPEGSNLFSGIKRGTLFLTSYRVIFVTSHSVNDPMLSFMMPFNLMSNCTVEQPVFAPNCIKGTIQAAPDGDWEGQATFKLAFRKGGAIEFAQLMTKAASAAYPVVVYGPQPMRYGAPLGGYGAPPAGYRAPPEGSEALPEGYRAPPAYGAPAEGSVAPLAGYEAPTAGYEAPPAGYRAPPAEYEAPPPGYGAQPAGYGLPPAGYVTPPAGNEAPPSGQEAPPTRNRAESHKSVSAQPAGYEASTPSASSSQAP